MLRRRNTLALALALLISALIAEEFDAEYAMQLWSIEEHKRDDFPVRECMQESHDLCMTVHAQHAIGTDHLRAIPGRRLLEIQAEDEQEARRQRSLRQATGKASSLAHDLRAIARSCRLTRGDWCGRFQRQQRIAYKAAPRGATRCPGNCSGVGNCNYDTGLCDCPAGWTGADCSAMLLRPCTNRFRTTGNVSVGECSGHL